MSVSLVSSRDNNHLDLIRQLGNHPTNMCIGRIILSILYMVFS